MNIYALFLFILLAIMPGPSSMGSPQPNAQAKKVIASIRMPTSFQADFVYAHTQADVKQGDIQEEYQIEGKIWVKGNKYRLVLEDQILVSNGETIWNYVPSMQEVQIYKEEAATADQDLTSFSPIHLLHLYEHGFIPIAFHTTTMDQKKHLVVALIPQEKKRDIKQLNLLLDQESHQIKSMQVLEKDSTVHNFSIVSLVVQNKLQDSFFEFQMPVEPVEVIDLR